MKPLTKGKLVSKIRNQLFLICYQITYCVNRFNRWFCQILLIGYQKNN